jgi:hypothetical protein
LADVTEAELLSLAEAERSGKTTGIKLAMNKILDARQHVFAIGLATDGSIEQSVRTTSRHQIKATYESGPCYYFSAHDRFQDMPELHTVFRSQ